jgi:hypothetical protein
MNGSNGRKKLLTTPTNRQFPRFLDFSVGKARSAKFPNRGFRKYGNSPAPENRKPKTALHSVTAPFGWASSLCVSVRVVCVTDAVLGSRPSSRRLLCPSPAQVQVQVQYCTQRYIIDRRREPHHDDQNSCASAEPTRGVGHHQASPVRRLQYCGCEVRTDRTTRRRPQVRCRVFVLV